MRRLKRAARIIGYVLLGLVGLLAALVLAIFTPPGRSAVRAIANRELASLFKGRIVIGTITELHWNGRLHATNITVRDPQGRLVAEGGELDAWPVRRLLPALFNGLRGRPGGDMPNLALHVRTVRLLPDAQGGPSILDAIASRTPAPTPHGPPSPNPTLRFGSIAVAIDRVESTLGGVQAEATGVRVHTRVELQPLVVVVDLAHAQVASSRNAPAALDATFAWHSHFEYHPPTWAGTDTGTMRGVVDVRGAELACHAEYLHAGVDTHASVSGCEASRAAIDLGAGQPLGLDVAIPSVDAGQSGTGPWHVLARAVVNAQPIDAEATVGGTDAVVEVTTHALDLERVRAALPRTDITGTIHFERHATRYVLNTDRLRAQIGTMNVPSFHAAVNLVGRDVTLEDLSSTTLGLVARGQANLDHPADGAHLELHLHPRDVGAIEPIRPRLRGRLDLDATADGRDGHVVARIDGSADGFEGFGARIGSGSLHTTLDAALTGTTPTQADGRVDLVARGVAVGTNSVGAADVHADLDAAFRDGALDRANANVALGAQGVRVAQTARVGSLNVHGTAVVTHGQPSIDATLGARGVVASNQGPLAIDATVHGDPLHALDGALHVHGTSPVPAGAGVAPGSVTRTALDSAFAVRLDPATIAVSLPRATIALHGAEGTLAANVQIPRGAAGALEGHVALATSQGGTADVTLRGTDVRGRFNAFPVAWVARAAGMTQPLGGTIDGDLSVLTSRAAAPRGTIRWRNGELPYLGPFDLALTADHTGAVSSYRLELDAGVARDQHLVADARVVPPAALGNTDGWLRGLRDATVQLQNVPLHAAEAALPDGLRIGGHIDARVVARHAEPESPIDLVLGFDARNAQLGRDIRVHVPQAIERIVPHPIIDPLTVALRARGTVCGTVRPSAPLDTPLRMDVALGREGGSPAAPLLTACDATAVTVERASLVTDPLLQLRGTLAGPWYNAATAAAREYARAVARTDPHAGGLDLGAATHHALAAAHTSLRVDVGPVDSERWPFLPPAAYVSSALARPGIKGIASVALVVEGSLDRPSFDFSVAASSHDVPQIAGRNTADGTMHVHLGPKEDNESILDEAQMTADGHVALHVRLDGDSTPGTGTADGHAVIQARLGRLLDPHDTSQAIERQDVSFQAAGVRLAWLTWAQQRGLDGTLVVRAQHSGDPATLATLEGTVTDVRASTGPAAVGLAFAANVHHADSGWRASVCAQATPGTGRPAACALDATSVTAPVGGLLARVEVPLAGSVLALTPQTTGITATLAANALRLEPLSPFAAVSPVERIGGALTAQIAWRGDAPQEVHGSVHLTDGMLWVEGSAPATGLLMDLVDTGRRVEITRLSAHIGRGTVTAHGTADLDPTGSGPLARVALALDARHLPIETDGNPFGEVTTRADFTANAYSDRLDGRVQLHTAQITLPTQSSHTVEDLAADPHVRVVRNGVLVSAGDAAAPASSGYPIDLDLGADAPITAVRNDLYVAVRADIHLHEDPHGTALSGGIELALAQSYFELLGKRFYIDRAAITFDGSTILDPVLHIGAHYDSPTAGRIDIAIDGLETNPQIVFTSEQQPDADQSQVLSMLVLGAQDSRGASDQESITAQAGGAIAGLLTGLTAGALTSSAREHFDFLPRIIADPGTTGLGSGRYGAGATTLNGRLYVEGTYGAAASYGGVLDPVAAESGASTQEFHGLVEYSLSPRWSVSGQYGTSNRFGADVYWTPLR